MNASINASLCAHGVVAPQKKKATPWFTSDRDFHKVKEAETLSRLPEAESALRTIFLLALAISPPAPVRSDASPETKVSSRN